MSKIPDLLCICGSSGSVTSIQSILKGLPESWTTPILILVHQQEDKESSLSKVFSYHTKRPIIIPHDGTEIQDNTIYIAPGGYHIQIEPSKTISYAMDEPIHFSRPSIDVLLETAAPIYQEKLMVILLSGSSPDGTRGVTLVDAFRGTVWIQDPTTTQFKTMVQSAIDAVPNGIILSVDHMIEAIPILGGDMDATENINR